MIINEVKPVEDIGGIILELKFQERKNGPQYEVAVDACDHFGPYALDYDEFVRQIESDEMLFSKQEDKEAFHQLWERMVEEFKQLCEDMHRDTIREVWDPEYI